MSQSLYRSEEDTLKKMAGSLLGILQPELQTNDGIKQSLSEKARELEAQKKQYELESKSNSDATNKMRLQRDILATEQQLADIKKLSESFEKFLAVQTSPVEIPYSPDNPIKAVRYIIPGFEKKQSTAEAGVQLIANPNTNALTINRPKTCACEVEFNNGVKMTFHPDKTTEVDYNPQLSNQDVESIVDETVMNAIEYIEKHGEAPQILFEFPGFPADSPDKAILEQHIFNSTMNKMLSARIKDVSESGKELSYVQKQDLVVEGFRKAGWTSDKIMSTGYDMTSIFISPNSNAAQDQFLIKLYGKKNQEILNNFAQGNVKTEYEAGSKRGGWRTKFLGVANQDAADREGVVHHAFKTFIGTIAPSANQGPSFYLGRSMLNSVNHRKFLFLDSASPAKDNEAYKALRGEGVTKEQIEHTIIETNKKVIETLKPSMEKNVFSCDPSNESAVKELLTDRQVSSLEKFGLNENQVRAAMANQVAYAQGILHSFISSRTAAECDNLAQVGLNDATNDENYQELKRMGFSDETIQGAFGEQHQTIQARNQLLSQAAKDGISMDSRELRNWLVKQYEQEPKNSYLDKIPNDDYSSVEFSRLRFMLEQRLEQASVCMTKLSAMKELTSTLYTQEEFTEAYQNDPNYQQLKAMGFDEESIYANAVKQQMMKEFIQTMPAASKDERDLGELESTNSLPNLPTTPEDKEIVGSEFNRQWHQISRTFVKIEKLEADTSKPFAERAKGDEHYKKLINMGYSPDDINNLNTCKNSALNELAFQLQQDSSPLEHWWSKPEAFADDAQKKPELKTPFNKLMLMGYDKQAIFDEVTQRHAALKELGDMPQNQGKEDRTKQLQQTYGFNDDQVGKQDVQQANAAVPLRGMGGPP